MSTPAFPALPPLPIAGLRSIDEVLAKLSCYKWRTYPAPEEGGRTAFTILGGNKETGEVHILAAIERGSAPGHEHLDGGIYGEMILTICGELEDVTDEGVPVRLLPGQMLFHRGGSVHVPRASGFWLGYYHQPRGSRLVSG